MCTLLLRQITINVGNAKNTAFHSNFGHIRSVYFVRKRLFRIIIIIIIIITIIIIIIIIIIITIIIIIIIITIIIIIIS